MVMASYSPRFEEVPIGDRFGWKERVFIKVSEQAARLEHLEGLNEQWPLKERVRYPLEKEITVTNEQDPSGIDQHQPGAKLDAGKLRPRLIFDSMARALEGVVRVGTFGANKYTDGGWLEVSGGIERYRDAQLRHESKRAQGEIIDPESGLPHDYHIAWNILAQNELKARRGDYDVDQK